MKVRTSYASVVTLAVMISLPLAAGAQQVKQRECGPQPGRTLQHFINELNPGDTLLVSGVCNENVVINERIGGILIDGQGKAVLNAVDDNAPAIHIRGRSVTIKGFTINGGRHGVQFLRGGTGTVDTNVIRNARTHGVGVFDNSFARIVDSIIEQNGGSGICICEHSSAEIGFRGDFTTAGSPNIVRNNGSNGITVNDASYAEIQSNTLHDNAAAGIVVSEGSSARIGFESGVPGTFAGANIVHNNGSRGIVVARSSTARIVANRINNNTGSGVGIFRGAQADVAANEIDGNSLHGIEIALGSGGNLADVPGTVTSTPNTGSNGRFGVSCAIGGYVAGTVLPLTGTNGPKSIGSGCFSTLP